MTAGLIRFLTGAQARWAGVDPVRPDGTVPQTHLLRQPLEPPRRARDLGSAPARAAPPYAAGRGARDYWERGAVRRHLALNVFRAVLIERAKVTARNNPLEPMEAALDAGDSLILFPEGTRTDDAEGEMNDFKPGLWHLARKHPDAELVPVHLENLNRILPKGEFILVPLLAAVTFGRPVRIEEGEEKPAFLERARRCVEVMAQEPEERG